MNQYSTPILKRFTIKSYVNGDEANSEASTRRALDEEAGQDGSTPDLPYFPPNQGNGGGGGGWGPGGSGGGAGWGPGGSAAPGGFGVGNPMPGGMGGGGWLPGGGSGSPSTPKLNVAIYPKPFEVCQGSNLPVVGVADGPYPISKLVLLVNGREVDHKDVVALTRTATGLFETSFQFMYPTESHSIGEEIVVEVRGFDNQNQQDSDSMKVLVKDCSSFPPQKSRNCLLFDSLHVEFFNQVNQELMKMDIPSDWLPYELNNSAGAQVTLGWGDNDGLMAWWGNGDGASGFQISSIGMNILDEYDKPKTFWAKSILAQSTETNWKTNLMLDDPSTKDPSTWINEIKTTADYSNAPTIGRRGAWINFGFDDTLVGRQCKIDKQIMKPEENPVHISDPITPDVPAYDPTKNPVRDCLLLDKVTFQYYSDMTQDIHTMVVPLSWFVTSEIPIQTKAGVVRVVVGWSNYFKGISLALKSATGTTNLQIVGVGVIFRDYYNNVKTAWTSGLNYKSGGVKNEQWIIGGPKTLSDLPWTAEVDGGNYSNAPMIGKQGDFIVTKHADVFSKNACSIDPSHDSDRDTHVIPDPVLKVTVPSEDPTVIDQCNNQPLTVEGFADFYPKVTTISATYANQLILNQAGSNEYEPFSLTIPSTTFLAQVPAGSGAVRGKKADIVFLIDYTGSMGSAISSVSSNLDQFVSQLTIDGVDYRLGLSKYADINTGQQVYKQAYTSDQVIFKRQLDAIGPNGGGDEPESGLEGFKDPMGALSFDFRSDAAKFIIMLTDAHVHAKDYDNKSAYTVSEVAQDCVNRGIIVTVIGPASNSDIKNQLSGLSTPTGGSFFDIKGDYLTQLKALADSISVEAQKEIPPTLTTLTITATDGDKTVSKDISINVQDCTV
jgi:hypothetical protein